MGKGRRRHHDAPHIRPVDVDGVRTVAILTILWAVAFVVLAFNREQLDEEGIGWLLWTCLAGVGLGLLGIEYTRKRRDAIAEAQLEAEAAEEEPDDAPHNDPGADIPPDHEAPHDPAGDQGDFPPRGPAEFGSTEATRQDRTTTRPIRHTEPTRPVRPETPPQSNPSPGTDPNPETNPRATTNPGLGTNPRATTNPGPATNPDVGTNPGPATNPGPGTTPGLGTNPGPGTTPGTPPAQAAGLDYGPPPGGRRRRRPSQGPDRPGRVDVADVGGSVPAAGEPPLSATNPGGEGGSTSPAWSELIDTPTTSQPSSQDSADDDALLDESTFSGRRAKQYDMTEEIQEITGEIQEITEGGGTVYRGRRARRRPDSA